MHETMRAVELAARFTTSRSRAERMNVEEAAVRRGIVTELRAFLSVLEIADLLAISQQRVRQILSEARKEALTASPTPPSTTTRTTPSR